MVVHLPGLGQREGPKPRLVDLEARARPPEVPVEPMGRLRVRVVEDSASNGPGGPWALRQVECHFGTPPRLLLYSSSPGSAPPFATSAYARAKAFPNKACVNRSSSFIRSR